MKQQILVGGIGGQGVLFVTGLLAEAAIRRGFPVLASETHGMAQRGGAVVSHLKVGRFFSPMIRPLQADGLLALVPESVAQQAPYIKPDGWIVANQAGPAGGQKGRAVFALDAARVAREVGSPKSVNLVLVGYAVARLSEMRKPGRRMFCSLEDLEEVVRERLAGRKDLLEACLRALEAGYRAR
ncbi:MAG: 2-oxoacid:acceptor oxidoreductase family protein [bacterium]